MELSLLFLQKMGVPGIILILIIVLLLFGGKKIPELMKGLGKGMKEFKGAANGDSDEKSRMTQVVQTTQKRRKRNSINQLF